MRKTSSKINLKLNLFTHQSMDCNHFNRSHSRGVVLIINYFPNNAPRSSLGFQISEFIDFYFNHNIHLLVKWTFSRKSDKVYRWRCNLIWCEDVFHAIMIFKYFREVLPLKRPITFQRFFALHKIIIFFIFLKNLRKVSQSHLKCKLTWV